eukprot:5286347-Amphidinium_carterae.2
MAGLMISDGWSWKVANLQLQAVKAANIQNALLNLAWFCSSFESSVGLCEEHDVPESTVQTVGMFIYGILGANILWTLLYKVTSCAVPPLVIPPTRRRPPTPTKMLRQHAFAKNVCNDIRSNRNLPSQHK